MSERVEKRVDKNAAESVSVQEVLRLSYTEWMGIVDVDRLKEEGGFSGARAASPQQNHKLNRKASIVYF